MKFEFRSLEDMGKDVKVGMPYGYLLPGHPALAKTSDGKFYANITGKEDGFFEISESDYNSLTFILCPGRDYVALGQKYMMKKHFENINVYEEIIKDEDDEYGNPWI